MPLPTSQNRSSRTYDALLVLRNKTAGAVAGNTAETGILLPVRSMGAFRAIINYDAFTPFAQGTATWTFHLEVSGTLNGAYVSVGRRTVTTNDASTIEIDLSGPGIQSAIPNAEYIRINAVTVGAPGAITYGCTLDAANKPD